MPVQPKQRSEVTKTKISREQNGGFGRVIMAVLIVLVVAGFGAAYYFYDNYNKLKNDPNIQAQEEMGVLLAEIGEFMQLPTDEAPTIATVLEKEKLQDQDFFRNAENGDKILAFVGAKKAILYRPSTKKIIEVAPIFIEANEEGQVENQTDQQADEQIISNETDLDDDVDISEDSTDAEADVTQ